MCLVATGTCVFVDKGQFFKLNGNKDSKDSSVAEKNNGQILNEDFFKCQAKKDKCSLVSKKNAEKQQIWSKIDRK